VSLLKRPANRALPLSGPRAAITYAVARRLPIGSGAAFCALLAAASVAAGGGEYEAGPAQENPCEGPDRPRLRCPDLQMRRPYDLRLERTPGGRALLRSASAIKVRGRGPVELHGRLIARRTMRVRQRIYRVNGSHLGTSTGGRLHFYYIPGQGRYWKFGNAARFELWSVDGRGRRKRLVRTGPKLHYCFRDLERTSRVAGQPRQRLYPGCSQNPRKRRVTLGTSIGWSDIYPADYHEQWIDVTGLRGCFAYVHLADPRNGIHESHEANNEAQRIVRLPFERGPGRCGPK
jgi:hypothetical protein